MSEAVTPSAEKCLTLEEFNGIHDRRRERRRHTRRRVRLYCIDDKVRHAVLSDCSQHGVSILLEEPIAADAQFMIQLKTEPVQMAAYTVRYWWKTNDGDYRIGAELVGIIGAPDGEDAETALRALIGEHRG